MFDSLSLRVILRMWVFGHILVNLLIYECVCALWARRSKYFNKNLRFRRECGRGSGWAREDGSRVLILETVGVAVNIINL